MENRWKNLQGELQAFYRQVPVQREEEKMGFSGHTHLSSVKKMYRLITTSLIERNMLIENQNFLDCGCGEGFALFPLSLTKMKSVAGIDYNFTALCCASVFAKKHEIRFPEIKRIWLHNQDLFRFQDFHPFSIVYMMNLVFPTDLNLHLFSAIFRCPSVHTLICSAKSFQQIAGDLKRVPRDSDALRGFSFWKSLADNASTFTLRYGSHRACQFVLLQRQNVVASPLAVPLSFSSITTLNQQFQQKQKYKRLRNRKVFISTPVSRKRKHTTI
jgi:SAM-dependent methyltransferase